MLFSVFLLGILLVSLIGARNVISSYLQAITVALTRSPRIGLWVYSLLFLPGVIIHEISHFFMAAFLGVRTGEISIFPDGPTEEGHERLGSVQVAKTDIFRSSLIGIAPLFFGSVLIIAITKWNFPQLLDPQFLSRIPLLLSVPLNWVWIYLIFAISNTMFVSSADRKSWPAMILVLLILAAIALWTGAASTIAVSITPSLNAGLNVLNAAFLITLGIDVIVLIPLILTQKLLRKW